MEQEKELRSQLAVLTELERTNQQMAVIPKMGISRRAIALDALLGKNDDMHTGACQQPGMSD